MNKPLITATPSAIKHIKEQVANYKNGIGFRLSVTTTGCNGFMYVPEIIDAINPSDVRVDTSEGLLIFVDAACQKILVGTEIDYIEKNKLTKILVYNNPNAEGTCGCGESFNLKENNE